MKPASPFPSLFWALLLLFPFAGCDRGESSREGGPESEGTSSPSDGDEAPAPKLVLTLMADKSKCTAGDRIRFSARVQSYCDEALKLILPASGEELGVYTLDFMDAEGKPLDAGIVQKRFRTWEARPLQASQIFDELQPRYTSILSLSRLLDRSEEVAFVKPGTYRARLVYDSSQAESIRKIFDATLASRCKTPEEFRKRLDKVPRDRFVSQDLTIEVLPPEDGKNPTGLQLNLRTVQTTHKVGDEIELRCEIENRTSRTVTLISFEAGGILGACKLLFEDEEGRTLKKGILVEGGDERTREEVQLDEIFIDLQPGQRVEFDPLRHLYKQVVYEFSKAGEYGIRLEYDVEDHEALVRRFEERLAASTEHRETVAKKLGTAHLGRAVSNTLAISVAPD